MRHLHLSPETENRIKKLRLLFPICIRYFPFDSAESSIYIHVSLFDYGDFVFIPFDVFPYRRSRKKRNRRRTYTFNMISFDVIELFMCAFVCTWYTILRQRTQKFYRIMFGIFFGHLKSLFDCHIWRKNNYTSICMCAV